MTLWYPQSIYTLLLTYSLISSKWLILFMEPLNLIYKQKQFAAASHLIIIKCDNTGGMWACFCVRVCAAFIVLVSLWQKKKKDKERFDVQIRGNTLKQTPSLHIFDYCLMRLKFYILLFPLVSRLIDWCVQELTAYYLTSSMCSVLTNTHTRSCH